jgi:hypothetical protein
MLTITRAQVYAPLPDKCMTKSMESTFQTSCRGFLSHEELDEVWLFYATLS